MTVGQGSAASTEAGGFAFQDRDIPRSSGRSDAEDARRTLTPLMLSVGLGQRILPQKLREKSDALSYFMTFMKRGKT